MSDVTRRTLMNVAAAGALAATTARTASAKAESSETIAIIGTGNVGRALGVRWAGLGHNVIYGSRSPDSEKTKQLLNETGHSATALPQSQAAQTAGIVLLATPAQAVLDIVGTMGDLTDKVVMDATNLLSFKDGVLVDPTDPVPTAARIQALAPTAFVVKAFNTISAVSMRDPSVTGGAITVPMAGADAAAKTRVSALTTALGLEVFDMGGAEALPWLEHLGRIFVGYSFANRPRRMEFSFRTWEI